MKRSRCSEEISSLSFRASRSERDARAYESRLKHYENEIAELKARSDAITFDATRRIEENEVRLFLHRSSAFMYLSLLDIATVHS